MRTERMVWTASEGWKGQGEELSTADWVLYFGAPETLDAKRFEELRVRYPRAILLGCTTGGEIARDDVQDGSIATMAVRFEHTRVQGAQRAISCAEESFTVGAGVARDLASPELRAVFVLSDGTRVNGTELVDGLRSEVHPGVVVSGGLAGDGARFGATRAGLNELPAAGAVCAIGLYGTHLTIGHGSAGGWVPFGPERLVTRSTGNVLYELDHHPALDLYKKYLGEEADRLPASALLYPLVIHRPGSKDALVRTILGIDVASNAMTFAGDIPEGCVAQLMRASFDQLVDGAATAAHSARVEADGGFAVLVSCIGRKLLLGQRACDEVDAVGEVLGQTFPMIGFYSYGEIAPTNAGTSELHNQTMTITTFAET